MYSQVNEKHLTDRLSVADILSSMANGADESSSVTVSLTIYLTSIMWLWSINYTMVLIDQCIKLNETHAYLR